MTGASPRIPFVLLLSVALGGAVVAGRVGGGDPSPADVGAEPGVQMPAVPAQDVLASTWYCAAGTAERGGVADHTVVVFNPGDVPVTGTVSVHTGDIAAPAPLPDGRGAGEASAEPGDHSAAGDRSGDGDTAAGDDQTVDTGDDEAAPGGDRGDAADAGSGQGRRPDGSVVGDPWAAGAPGPAAPPAPAAAVEDIEVAPGARAEIHLADLATAPLAAALVEVDGAVAVEHEVSGTHGRDVGPCASASGPVWHLAWGATSRDAQELLVLFNPFPSAAAVDIVFSTDAGIRDPVRLQGLPVPAGGVVGVDAGDDVPREADLAATVRSRSESPVVVERLQTFDGSVGPEGLSLALATPAPLQGWVFADGSVGGGRGERIVLYNPTRERAEVDVTVRVAAPEGEAEEGAAEPPPEPLVPFGVTIAPGRFEVVDYAEERRVPRRTGHATVVVSRNGVPVVAERVLTFEARDHRDLASGVGAAFAARRWTFATDGGGEAPQNRIVAYNPSLDRPARLSIAAVTAAGTVAPEDVQGLEVPPGQRREVRLGGELRSADIAVVVTSDAPLVVERRLIADGGLARAVGPGLPAVDDAVPLQADRL